MWVAATPLIISQCVFIDHPGYLNYFIMSIKTQEFQAVTTANAELMAQMEELYGGPMLAARLKDLSFNLIMMVQPRLPIDRVRNFDDDIDFASMLHYIAQEVENKLAQWNQGRRATGAKQHERVKQAIASCLSEYAAYDEGDAYFTNMERSINTLLHAANRWGEQERVQDFWIDHAETMEWLMQWLFNLQGYYMENGE